MADTQNGDVKEWIIATAASDHMTGDVSCIIDPVPVNQVFHAINGDVTAIATGSARLLVENPTGERHHLRLSNVFLVPGLPRGLASMSKLNFEFRWGDGSQNICKRDKDGNIITLIELDVRQGLYYLPIVQDTEVYSQLVASSFSDEEVENTVRSDDREHPCENHEPLIVTSSLYVKAN